MKYSRPAWLMALWLLVVPAFLIFGCFASGGGGGSGEGSTDDDTGDDDVDDDDSGGEDDDTAADDDAADDDVDDDNIDDDAADDDNVDDDAADDDSADDDTVDDDSADDDTWSDENSWGLIYVTEGHSSSNLSTLDYYNYVGATFYDPDDHASWISDPVESDGPCDRYFYDYPSDPIDYNYLNGGNVTVTGANVSPIHLTPTAYTYGYYYTPDYEPTSVSDLFAPGDIIHYTTAGHGILPAFSGQLAAPQMINITQPANFDALTSLPSGAMAFSWTPGDARWVTVSLSTMRSDYKSQSIVCTVDDADGTVTVPGSLMSNLYSNPYSMYVSVTRFALVRDTEQGKDCDLQISTYRQRSFTQAKR